MRARRALLYTPGDDLHKIQKATTLGVDCICMDLEDGVAVNHKGIARETVAIALRTLEFHSSEKLTRINPIGSGLEIEDLLTVLPSKPDGIVIPKVISGDQINWVDEQITATEKQHCWSYGSIVLLALIETARGFVNLREIATSSTRLEALIFGAEDMAADIGAQRSKSGWEMFYARSAVVTYSAAYNLQAIDLVTINFSDLQELKTQTTQGMRMGYEGKQIIHPNQVEPVQEIYTPDQKAILEAQAILKAYSVHQEEGQGAFVMDGKMIDAPVMKSALRTINRARAAEIS